MYQEDQLQSCNHAITVQDVKDILFDGDDDENSDEELQRPQLSQDSSYQPSQPMASNECFDFQYKKSAVEFWLGSKRKRSFRCVRNKFSYSRTEKKNRWQEKVGVLP